VLSQSAPEAEVSHPLDRAFVARLRETVERATAALDELDYAGALDSIERFFWAGFTDNYVEMVKARARSETDPAGRASAVATLQLGLSVLVRLLAPYLPYVTEEVWSWTHAGEAGMASIHRAPWPSAAELGAADEGAGAVFESSCGFLEAVRRAKSGAGATVGRHLRRLRVAVSAGNAKRLAPCMGDLAAAARVAGDVIEAREGLADDAFEVLEIELEAAPAPE
jgi:valyl-tRNA synthetase